MLKIFTCFFIIFSTLIVQAQNSFSVLKRDLEKKVLYSQHREVLDLINQQRDNYPESQRWELDVIKLECLNDLGLVDEAFALSQNMLSHPLSPELRLRIHMQRALIYEIGMSRKNCKRELDAAERILQKYPSLKPSHNTYFLIRKTSYYRIFDDHRTALKLASEAEKYAEAVNDRKNGATLNMLLGLSSYSEPEKARKHFEKAVKLCKAYHNYSGTAAMYNTLCRFYIDRNEEELAEKYADSAIAIVPKVEIYYIIADAYYLKSQIAEQQQRYFDALKHYRLATEWTQKNTEAQREVKVQELDLMYNSETDKLRQTDLQNNMKSTKRWNNMLLLCTLLLVFFTLLLLYFLRLISKNKERIEIQKQSISEKNAVLKKNIEEKQFLVRELNHRVKNNLSVILSLVRFQRDETTSEFYKNKFEQLHSRISTISLAHHLFSYNMNNFENSVIETQAFTHKIINAQKAGYPQEIIVDTQIGEFQLPVDQGLAYGLLLNELFTNSLKHATPEKNTALRITLKLYLKENTVYMEYQDNGTSFGSKERHKSLGRFIIDAMVEQLHGKCNRENSVYRVCFPIGK